MCPFDSPSLSEEARPVQVIADVIVPSKVGAWQAVFDHTANLPLTGAPIPVGMHWTLCAPFPRQSELGDDGVSRDHATVPPVPWHRRRWAGSRTTFHGPLLVGDHVERHSKVVRVVEKQGRAGPLLFLTVQHRLFGSQGLAIDEEQDFVFSAPETGPAAHADAEAGGRDGPRPLWQRTVRTDPVLLFRYASLTGNAHRIHYDRPYATEVEGYDGLVVQGPLLASLMLDLLREHRPDAVVEAFDIRIRRSTCDTAPLRLFGAAGRDDGSLRFWSLNHRGAEAAQAEVRTS